MIKRTLYFGNPSYLHRKDTQLKVRITKSKEELASIAIEDIAVLILDNPQVILSHALLQTLIANTMAVISCHEIHHPVGMF